MKKVLFTLPLLALGFASAQAPAASRPAPVQPAAVAPAALPKQVHIAISPFECGAYSCNAQVAKGVGDALTNALIQSNRFAVYERNALGAGAQEGMLGGSDMSGLQGADVLVTGTITTYGEDSSGGNACFLGICAGSKEERIVVNLRIFDVKSSRVIAATQAEGKSSTNAASLNLGGFSLGGNQASGMDKAVSAMLVDAVNKLSATIPASYYH